MSRVHTLFFAIVPTLIAGGFLFTSESGHAEAGSDGALGFWPAASDSATGSVIVAQADPRPRGRQRIPMPPNTPVPPVPPAPPTHPGAHGRGPRMSISIHDGKIEIDGIAELVSGQLEGVLRALDNMPNVAPDARERLKARVRGVRDKIKVRLSRLKSMDLDKVGVEVERIGDEIEKEMEGVDKDLQQLGDKLSKHFAEKFGKDFGKGIVQSFGPGFPGADHSDGDDDDDDDDGDDDDRDAVVLPPGVDTDRVDPSDLQDKIAALGNLRLSPEQKQKLAKLRAESDQKIAGAKRELDEMSIRLHETLGDSSAKESDIERQIDRISEKEATIRKARILTWIRVRSLLRDDQRQMIEAATRRQP